MIDETASDTTQRSSLQRFLNGTAIALVLAICLFILRPLLSVLGWATILACASWPLHRLIRRWLGHAPNLAALCTTTVMAVALLVPTAWATVLLSRELVSAYQAAATLIASYQSPATIPEALQRLPWIGEQLQPWVDQFASAGSISHQAVDWAQSRTSEIGRLGGSLLSAVGAGALILLTAFFIYRDGESIMASLRSATRRSLGIDIGPHAAVAGSMINAVLIGFLATAFAQGVIAGLGYAIVGLRRAALLGALTGLVSAVPILGTSLVWGPVGLYLALTGHIGKGLLILAWGLVLVHPTDNFLRPLLISNATQVPLLGVMFGAIGGIAAWGLVGGVLGPVAIAIGFHLWRQWTARV